MATNEKPDWPRDDDEQWAAEVELRLVLDHHAPAGLADEVLAEAYEAVVEAARPARDLFRTPRTVCTVRGGPTDRRGLPCGPRPGRHDAGRTPHYVPGLARHDGHSRQRPVLGTQRPLGRAQLGIHRGAHLDSYATSRQATSTTSPPPAAGDNRTEAAFGRPRRRRRRRDRVRLPGASHPSRLRVNRPAWQGDQPTTGRREACAVLAAATTAFATVGRDSGWGPRKSWGSMSSSSMTRGAPWSSSTRSTRA